MGIKTKSQHKREVKGTNLILLALLQQKGLKQSDLAKEIGIDRAYINRVIHSKEEAPTLLKIKIAQILGVDSRAIWNDQIKFRS